MKKHQDRTLGAFEKTFWLLDRIDSKDFALAAEITGNEPEEKWRNALIQVQQRHQNLSGRIVMDEMSRPVLQHVDHLPIPLRVLHADQGYRWEQEVEKELSVRFDTEKGPLVRAVLIQMPQSTILILAANHSLADGTAVSYLIRDILLAVGGNNLEPMDLQLSNDQTLGFEEDLPVLDTHIAPVIASKLVKPLVASHQFSEDMTNQILQTARKENTTLHGALCAAALLASRNIRKEWSDTRMELVSPVCTRAALHLDDNFGLNITTQSVFFEKEEQLSFWELARLAKAGLDGTNSAEYVTGYLSFFRDIVFGHNDIEKMLDVLKTAFNHHIMVTNLVRVKYKTDFGALKLKSVFGPMVRSGKGMEQTIGAISTNGALCLTNTSDNPIPDLLITMEEILRNACHANTDLDKGLGNFQEKTPSCPLT